MKPGVSVALSVVIVASIAGCNTLLQQPRMEQALITPAVLAPGDSADITVTVRDKYGVVQKVEGVVVEDQRVKFPLRNDGVPPDVTAGDNVWSLTVDVPFLAPSGQFTLEFTAYDSRGNPVSVQTKEGASVLKKTCTVVIEYPPEEDTSPESAPAEEQES